MKKTFAALLAVASIAGSLSATPAKAHDGVGVGLAAGLLGGALVGGAIAASRPAPDYYPPGPVYYEGAPPPPPGCYWQQRRYWDGYGWYYHPVRVCY
ncbi:MAG TPA: hypothetical protein VKR55_06970 [Bradyrhizobium sp.]|uniref:hypothetical protein n=1 Tax=Bradyrhizobium sp. TaxID=376 RepID=UPI002BD0538B|nr:hypothetical protein [Bradyrhizobium sp.]HLZ01880.1 hypothetical protein [Bradyrhizobium sp.]